MSGPTIFRVDEQTGEPTLVYDETVIIESMRATTVTEALLDVYEVKKTFLIIL